MAPSWAWQDDAACWGEDLVLFFGPDGERQPERDVRELKAKAICHGCPVRRECRDYAEDSRVAGIWGGLSEEDRKRERRRRSRATTRSAA
jgi:WhiB family redox-sensing transcriptional regulator